ncbi:MAG TPA: chemotaxis protein CheC [Candidatus Polarisedimenticolia bacterium]|jgi:chemotaxis protein CheC
MKPFDPATLTPVQLAALRRASAAGARSAVAAISGMTGWTLERPVPKVRSLRPDDVTSLMGGAEIEMVGLRLGIRGEPRGELLIALQPASAHRILGALLPGAPPLASLEEMSPIEESALREAGNILGAAYLGALGSTFGRALIPTVPELAIDMAGALTDDLLVRTGRGAESTLVIEVEIGAKDHGPVAHLLHLPDSGCLPAMLAALSALDAIRPSPDPFGV